MIKPGQVKNIEKFQWRMLRRAKAKRLGPIEALSMKLLGRGDGRDGLPRKSQTGGWESPRLRKEANAYYEFCDRAWGATQLQLAETYKKAGVLIDVIKRKEEMLEQLTGEAPVQPGAAYFETRKNGEEDLTDDQIRVRRSREILKQNAPYHAKVRAIEAEIETAYSQLRELQNHIAETNNGTRLVCERLKSHTEQRRDAYWNAAIRTHPAKETMPVTPEVLPESEAEQIYTAHHKNLEEVA